MTVAVLGHQVAVCEQAYEMLHSAHREYGVALEGAEARVAAKLEPDRSMRAMLLAHRDAECMGARTKLWMAASSLLTSAGNLSKLLWPASETAPHQEEHKALRVALKTEDNSPLHSRAVRNHFEHYDDRLFKHQKRKLPESDEPDVEVDEDGDEWYSSGPIHITSLFDIDPEIYENDAQTAPHTHCWAYTGHLMTR